MRPHCRQQGLGRPDISAWSSPVNAASHPSVRLGAPPTCQDAQGRALVYRRDIEQTTPHFSSIFSSMTIGFQGD
jgi:hypothetical protein